MPSENIHRKRFAGYEETCAEYRQRSWKAGLPCHFLLSAPVHAPADPQIAHAESGEGAKGGRQRQGQEAARREKWGRPGERSQDGERSRDGARCNRNRPHSTIGYQVPAKVMDAFFERTKPTAEGAVTEPAYVERMAAERRSGVLCPKSWHGSVRASARAMDLAEGFSRPCARGRSR